MKSPKQNHLKVVKFLTFFRYSSFVRLVIHVIGGVSKTTNSEPKEPHFGVPVIMCSHIHAHVQRETKKKDFYQILSEQIMKLHENTRSTDITLGRMPFPKSFSS